LSVAAICSYSGWSRATVYRLFEADGGLFSYIQQRRLQRALMELIFERHGRRVLDIALENQFASEATFNRAFRRTFGLPPGEARTLAQHPKGRNRAHSASDTLDERHLTIRRIQQLVAGPGRDSSASRATA
jgi:AraC-like DNA-binding protein